MGGVLLAVLLGAMYGGVKLGWLGASQVPVIVPSGGGNDNTGTNNCPDTQITAVTVSARNALNDASAEYLNYTAYVYYTSDPANKVATWTDTGAEGSKNFDCPSTIKVVGIAGDKTRASWEVEKTLNSATKAIEINTAQMSGITAKVKDENMNAFKFCGVENSSSTYVTVTGATYCGDTATNNETAEAVDADGEIEGTIYVKTASADTQFGDVDTYIGVDVGSSLTIWEDPLLQWGGVELTKESTLPSKVASDGYDYLYKLPESSEIITDSQRQLHYDLKAKSGQNPTANVLFGFFASGKYLSVDGNTIKTGIHKDDTSFTYVHTPEVATLDLS